MEQHKGHERVVWNGVCSRDLGGSHSHKVGWAQGAGGCGEGATTVCHAGKPGQNSSTRVWTGLDTSGRQRMQGSCGDANKSGSTLQGADVLLEHVGRGISKM